ncbi:MAG: FadR family transcriptional regulator [Deltaproteobacteria bacterium]|nr:FadR family transcriptional regulator [Deltaproteobacteria bacterium]
MTTKLNGTPLAVFTPIRAERISEKVANQLRKLIAEGVFKVGDRLPSERDLSEQMGVSRTSVREALQTLEVQGILETVHGGGSIVRNITGREIRPPIEQFLGQDKRRVLELAELRAFMEAWAAREAARNRSEAELATMRGYLEEMERDFENGRIRYDVDFRYHTEIAAATHNTIYLHLIDNIYHLINYSVKVHREEVFVSREDQETILSHHRRIFGAIRDRDPDAAEREMKEHLAFVVREFRRKFFEPASAV